MAAGRYANGSPRRLHRTVHVPTEAEATRALAEFVAELRDATPPDTTADRDITVDDAVERYLTEHLQGERGREQGTIDEYRGVHTKWFSREIGGRRLRDVDEATIDRLFGRMREAGLSRSRMNAARSLYAPMFRWARRRGIVRRNPMAEFELPTSVHVTRERVPPEVEQLSRYLGTAVELVPDVAPVLTLGAVTGMRRGELVSVRRLAFDARRGRLRVDTGIAGNGSRRPRPASRATSCSTSRRSRCSSGTAPRWMLGPSWWGSRSGRGASYSASNRTARCRCRPSTSRDRSRIQTS